MVSVSQIAVSNDLLPTHLPANLVAIFVGGTSGLGEAAVKAFSKSAVSPHVYIVGRSQVRAQRVIGDCKVSNPDGEYSFLQADLDLMRNVDAVCEKIKAREKVVNLLFLSQGGANNIMDRAATSEGLNSFCTANFYSRNLFALNLLPLLKAAASAAAEDSSNTYLSRVVTIAGGTKEGSLYLNDLPVFKMPIYAIRGHVSTMTTFTLEELHARAPEVSFVHYYPGFVQTPLFDQMPGYLGMALRTFSSWLGPWIAIPNEESGKRMLFVSTSARYAPGGVDSDGQRASGTLGEGDRGVYSLDEHGEPAGRKTLVLLKSYRTDRSNKKVWEHVEGEFKRIQETAKNSG